jgi:hypothetical protein
MELNVTNSWQSGKFFYLLLWSVALLMIAVTLMFGIGDKTTGKSIFKNKSIETAEVSNETINALLLSADELNIGEKNSFINLYLKPDDNGSMLSGVNNETDREAMYNTIFTRKINNLNSKNRNEDFSVKPIPK